MINVKDHHTQRLFDPWEHLGPKRRRLLDNSWAGLFREHLFEKIPVTKIAVHFDAHNGRPTKELYTVIGVLALQQVHDLSDEAALEAVAFNTQWHFALDITGESDSEKYLCEKTLRTYRTILIEERLDGILFEEMTDTLLKHFGIDTSKQRFDSGHILSNMRTLRRTEIFAKTIEKFLKKLKQTYKELFDSHIEPELVARYLAKESGGCFSRVKPSEAAQTLEQLSEDLLYLVELFKSDKEVKKLHAYRMLKRVLSEQCRVSGKGKNKKMTLKEPKEISSDSLQNPSDPDATYDGHKGKGYQVQIMETYQQVGRDEKPDKTKPNLITYVSVEQAHKHDADALQPALDNTRSRGCAPDELQCDAAYGSDENVQKAGEKGISVIAPVKGPSNSPATGLKDFTFDDSTHLVKCCPLGYKPVKVKRTKSHYITAGFSKEHCCACPNYDTCPVKIRKRGAYLRYNEKQFRLAQRRAHEQTAEFFDTYRWRAGIEGTISHYKADTGAGRLRVRRLVQVRFAAALKALGVNILRAAKAYALTFRSLFARFFGLKNGFTASKTKSEPYPIRHTLLLSKNKIDYASG